MRTTVLITVGVAIALLLLFGCPKEQPPAPPQRPTPPAPLLIGLPVEMTVEQRTTTPAPGSKGAVQVTIDDITRGQVMLSLADKTGKPLLAATSLREGDSVPFELDGQTYYVTLKDLENELVGDDSAVLVIDDEPPLESATQPSEAKAAKEGDAATPDDIETARIQKLIDLIRSNKGAVFIRNGQEHTPAEAADHLERKWKAAGAAITTAEEFIDKIASRSSTTGEPYRIQFDRGESDASEWLQLHLARIKKEEAPGSVNE